MAAISRKPKLSSLAATDPHYMMIMMMFVRLLLLTIPQQTTLHNTHNVIAGSWYQKCPLLCLMLAAADFIVLVG